MLPTGAKPIVDARIAGKRPADLLIVSLVGRLPAEVNPVVQADGDDWRFIEGLKVCVFARPGTPFREVCKRIAYCGPAWLGLWDVENREGATVHLWIRPESIDNRRFSIDDFTLDIDAWIPWQNRIFEAA